MKDVSSFSFYVKYSVYSRRRLDLELITIQSIWLELSYKSTSILVDAVYTPPKSPVPFWDDLNISMERALDVNTNVVLLGDLNENLFNDIL